MEMAEDSYMLNISHNSRGGEDWGVILERENSSYNVKQEYSRS